jgi:hypothetical protein
MNKKNKDPLKPEKDVRIEDKEHGFLKTLTDAVKTPKKDKKQNPEKE